uniref:DNA-directed RNA polymerases I and III subunit RPAC1 n=1 Tax=Lygus hesperus TaxID=30085 RepID=A0A0A9YFB5_LYGHE
MKVQRLTDEVLEIDIKGIDAPIANALRRIMLTDVPTLAIEKVILFQNTSIIQDEVLAHRLGLVPIVADPNEFASIEYDSTNTAVSEPDEYNTTVMTLQITCSVNPNASLAAPPHIAYKNDTVYTRHLVWVPQGDQEKRLRTPIRPVHDDIVIAKLRPGQCIEAELHLQKGTGRQHAKWSPCATVYYRQMPHIEIVEPFTGSEADRLVKLCPMGVFDVEDITSMVDTAPANSQKTAFVARPRDCTLCRECVRDPNDEPRIRLLRHRDYFLFTVESSGSLPPEQIFRRALQEFEAKAKEIESSMDIPRYVTPICAEDAE